MSMDSQSMDMVAIGSGGGIQTTSNVGAGAGLALPLVGADAPFKSLTAGANITLTPSGTEISISTSGAVGEANTTSNSGTGEGLAQTKVGVDLPFKSLIGETDKIILTGNTDDITITIGTDIVTLTDTQILTNKTIDDFTNDNHADTVHIEAYNNTGGLLTAGTVVYISGFNVGADLPEVSAADASAAGTMPAIGIVTTDISDVTAGDITAFGFLSAITTGFVIGDTLYVSETTGALTNVRPSGTALVQNIGTVLKVGGVGVGRIDVTALARSNDLPNLPTNNVWIGNGSGVSTPGLIANANIDAGAAIATSKLAEGAQFVQNDQANTYTGAGDQDFGSSALRNVAFLESNAANPSSVGAVRLGLTETIGWRHSSGTTDFLIGYDLHTNNDFVFEFTTDRNVANPASLTVIDNRAAAAGRDITSLNFVALDDGSNLTTYGTIVVQQEAIGAASLEEGSMRFHVRQAGDVIATFITLNDNEGDDITFFRPLDMFSRGISNVDGTDGLSILNPADTFSYQIVSSAILANRVATLPLLLASDTFVFENHIQTLVGKTLTTPTIGDFTNSTHDHQDAAGGGVLAAAALPGTIVYNDQANTFGAGLKQTVSHNGTTAGFNLGNVAGNPSAPVEGDLWYNTTTDRINYRATSSTQEVVSIAGVQTLTNKTLTTPTIGDFTNATHDHQDAAGGGTLLSTAALSDTANIAYLNTANVYTAGVRQDFLGLLAGTAGLNFGSIAGDPTTLIDGDVWYNSSTGKFRARENGGSVDMISAAGGGEANVTADVGGGAISIRGSTPKTGVALNLRTFANGDGINASVGADLITLAVASTVVQTDQANTYGAFSQSFRTNTLLLANPALTFNYHILTTAIAASRNITLPILIADDIFVFADHIQNLTNKTLTTPTIASFVNATHNHQTAAGGGTLDSTLALSDTANIAYLNTANTYGDGLTQLFNPNNTNAGINVGENATDPSAPVNGDLYYQTSVGLRARIEGAWVTLGAGGGGEANTISSLGGGTVLTAAVPKSGVNLQTVSIATTGPLTHAVVTDLLTFDINDLVNADIAAGAAIVTSKLADAALFVLNNQANTYTGAGLQDFASSALDNVASLTSAAAIVPTLGVVNLGNNESIRWRNNGNTDDLRIVGSPTDEVAIVINGVSEFSVGTNLVNVRDADITNINTLQSNAIAIPAAGTVRLGNAETVRWRNGGDTNDNYITFNGADAFEIRMNVVAEYAFSATQLDMNDNNLIMNDGIVVFADSNTTIQSAAQRLQIDYGATFGIDFRSNNTTIASVDDTGINLLANSLRFSVDGHDIVPSATALTLDLGVATDDFIFQTATVTRLTISDTIVNAASGVTFQENGVDISPIGTHDQYISAGGFDEVTAGPVAVRTVDGGVDRKVLRYMPFTTGVVEFATVMFQLPRNYNNGTITVIVHWTTEIEGAGTVEWDLSAFALSDGADYSATVFPAAVTVTDTQSTINFEQLSPRSAAITIGGTPAAEDMIVLKIARDGVNDTFTSFAQLLGISVEVSLDAATAT